MSIIATLLELKIPSIFTGFQSVKFKLTFSSINYISTKIRLTLTLDIYIIYIVDFRVNFKKTKIFSRWNMPKSEKQIQDYKSLRKSQILGAALKVFCEKGYKNTYVDDVCKKAGVSHGLFYHYFDNKETLFHEVMRQRHHVIHDDMINELKAVSSYRDKLKLIINALFDNMKNDENAPYYFFLFISGMFNKKTENLPPPPTNEKSPKIRFFDIFKEIFTDGQKSGEFSKKYKPEELAKLLHSVISGATLMYIITPKEMQSNISFPDVDMIIDIFSKGATL